MRFFTLLLDPDGRGIPEEVRRQYEALPRRRDLGFAWQAFHHAVVLTAWDDPYGDPLVARDGTWIAAGMVRLDNRPELERWVEGECRGLTDLEVVLRLVARNGPRYIPRILGDFGFVVWNGLNSIAVAACDAFAVKRLYHTERRGLLVFASRAEALAVEERYDVEFLVKLLALHTSARDRSVYAGVAPVPAASVAILSRGALEVQQYWNASAFSVEHDWEQREQEIVHAFRDLLATSIRLRMDGERGTWAQLSGGLDSSSVVSLTQWLAERGQIEHGLAGTVTYVDRQGTGADERDYSNAVVCRWGLRNETILNAPNWHEDGSPPPYTDQPTFDLQVYPRERRLCASVTAAGGRVLLTGWGGDELLMGSMLYFADWMARGRPWHAVREMMRVAVAGRVSFWELAFRNAIGPLLPNGTRNWLLRDKYASPVQPWLGRAALKRHGITSRNRLAPDYSGAFGHKYEHATRTKIGSLSELTDRGLLGDLLDVRHPFMYRPLVELALRLPPALRARSHAHRWVLREAMRGILPEQVRARVGKPDTGAALAWALASQRDRLAVLVKDPILGELGIIDASKLESTFSEVMHGTLVGEYMHAHLQSALAVEAWLRMRCGRWPQEGMTQAKALA